MKPLEGKVALVTGASRGIGRGCAIALAEAGADVAVNYLVRAEAARETCSRIVQAGRRALPVQGDVSKTADVNRVAKTVEEKLGTVQILINNAGVAVRRPTTISRRKTGKS